MNVEIGRSECVRNERLGIDGFRMSEALRKACVLKMRGFAWTVFA